MNTTSRALFEALVAIDYLSEATRLQTFQAIMDAHEDIAQLDPDLIILIICSFAALNFKEEVFLLIRSFNKSIHWLSQKNQAILIRIYLHFGNV